MGFDAKHIRPLAVAVVRNGNKVLAMKAYDQKKKQTFYRLLGGGIEFGEKAEDAVIREWQEELGVTINITARLGVEESIFTYEGWQGHEIVFFFAAELPQASDYGREFKIIEKGGETSEIVWVEVNEDNAVYPEGFRKFI